MVNEMLCARTIVGTLREAGVGYFAGVPDSLLAALVDEAARILPRDRHVVACNEGAAVGLALGHFAATGELTVVYLQNSGLGHALNPVASLAHPEVYGVPMLLLIGWRGAPGVRDAPQHRATGAASTAWLEAAGISWEVLPDDLPAARATIHASAEMARRRSAPTALLVKPKAFPAVARDPADAERVRTRRMALSALLDLVPPDAVLVATTGYTCRELFELRRERDEDTSSDFLSVGGMGHALSVATGIAAARPQRRIVCIDGDGALLMHTGSLATVGKLAPRNLHHLVLNNRCHDSVGGCPTAIEHVDVPALARALGYREASSVPLDQPLTEALDEFLGCSGPAMLEVLIAPGSPAGLARPSEQPQELLARLRARLAGTS